MGQLRYRLLKMSDGTEYRVQMEADDLLQVLNDGLRASQLVTLPMGIEPPGRPVVVNPSQVVGFDPDL